MWNNSLQRVQLTKVDRGKHKVWEFFFFFLIRKKLVHPRSSSLHVAPPTGRKVSLGCIRAHHHQYYLEYDGNWCILWQRVVSQVKSALFNNHVSSAFLLMSRAGIKDKIKNLPFKILVRLLLTENGLKSVWDMIRAFIDLFIYCIKFTQLIIREILQYLVTEAPTAPFLSCSTMIRFFDSCSWIRMTFSWPFTIK